MKRRLFFSVFSVDAHAAETDMCVFTVVLGHSCEFSSGMLMRPVRALVFAFAS